MLATCLLPLLSDSAFRHPMDAVIREMAIAADICKGPSFITRNHPAKTIGEDWEWLATYKHCQCAWMSQKRAPQAGWKMRHRNPLFEGVLMKS